MKNKKLLLGVGVLALVLAAGFLASGRSLQGATRNARNTPAAPVTLTFAASPNPVVGGEIVAGAQSMAFPTGDGGILVARYQVTASGPANNQVTITNLNFENDYDDQNPLANDAAVSQVSLHFPTSYSSPANLNGVAFATLNLDGQAQFSGLNFKLRGGVPTQFEVKVASNPIDLDIPAGDQIEMDLSPKYVAVNNRTGATIDGEMVPPDGLDGPEFTLTYGEEEETSNIIVEPAAPVPQGSLSIALATSTYNQNGNIAINSNPSAYSFSGAGNNQHYIGQYNISSSGERFHIDTLTISIPNGETAIQNLYIRYPKYSSTGAYIGGILELPATSITNGEAIFSNLNIWTPLPNPSNQNWFMIKAVLKPLGQGSNAGDIVEVDIPLNGTFHAVGQTSGAVLTQPNGNAADVDGPNKTIVAAAPAAPPPPPSPYGTGNSAAAAPTVNLLINGGNGPVNINSGNSIALSWTTTNATACIAEAYPPGAGAWSGSRATSGSETLNQITTSRNYMLTCWSGSAPSEGTTTTDSVMVNVAAAATPPPTPPGTGNSAAASPTVNLLVNGSNGPVTTTGSVAQGGGVVYLSWSNSNASSATCTKSIYIPMPLDETIYSGVEWSGTLPSYQNENGGQIRNVPSSRTFTLSCTTPAGTAQDSVEVNVPN